MFKISTIENGGMKFFENRKHKSQKKKYLNFKI